MKNRILVGALAALLSLSATVTAEEVFVRNRPFKQVIKVGSESYVPAEQLLKALGYNWTVKGQTVALTTEPAANGEFPTGSVQLLYGEKSLNLESTRRGSQAYVSLSPVAKFLDYSVVTNRSAGTIDVNKGRLASDSEKKMLSAAEAAKAEKEKETREAWEKKAAEIKDKREAKNKKDDGAKTEGDKAEGDKPAEGDKGKGKTASKGKKEKTEPKEAAQAEPPKEAAPAEDKDKEKKNEPKPAPRLEVFRADAKPDYSTGVVTIEAEVRNQGNGPADTVSGTVSLYGTNDDGKEVLWYRSAVRGPALKPDGSWTYKYEYRHRSGASMPHGNLRVDLKMN